MPFKNNKADIFTDGHSFFLALLNDIGQAKHHIHLETYIICDDPLGRLVADALMDKARRGVEVRLIYDDVGCWNVPNSFFERMRTAGIDVHAFMPVKFPAFTSKVNYRNHRKLCIIDGRIGYIGGMNIAIRYVKGSKGTYWRDTHLRIRGGAVYGIQRAFLVDWYFVDRTLITNRCYYPVQDRAISNDCIMQVVTSSPISQWPEMMQGYVRILLEAKKYVYMETPYFLPTEPVMFAMRTAALAGVDVKAMVPLHSDAKFVEWASRSYVQEAVDAGVDVRLYASGFNHSKVFGERRLVVNVRLYEHRLPQFRQQLREQRVHIRPQDGVAHKASVRRRYVEVRKVQRLHAYAPPLVHPPFVGVSRPDVLPPDVTCADNGMRPGCITAQATLAKSCKT